MLTGGGIVKVWRLDLRLALARRKPWEGCWLPRGGRVPNECVRVVFVLVQRNTKKSFSFDDTHACAGFRHTRTSNVAHIP